MYLNIVLSVVIAFIGYQAVLYFKEPIENVKVDDFIKSHNKHEKIDMNEFATSVWCRYDKTANKICTFQNMCYVPETGYFVFVLENESIISGLNSKEDIKTIGLSSVENHTATQVKLDLLLNNRHYFADAEMVDEPILLISRFKPDNVMHVIHDDILPIFMTYDQMCTGDISLCAHTVRLMFADIGNLSEHEEWYRMFSHRTPYDLKDIKKLTCFKKLFVGLSRESVLYQYGFDKPQGPVKNCTLDSIMINKFKTFVLNSLNINKPPNIKSNMMNVALFSRKINRKILNENFVINKIIEITRDVYPEYANRINVFTLDPSQNKTTEILSVVSNSQILVGMHGASMAYSFFLPLNAAIVELFPFGIQPQSVSTIRPLSLLPGIFYNYLSWRNFKEINSIGHPDRPPLLGGIQHLPVEEQDKILKRKEIPAVECCYDPAYMYRMYQDTKVDDNFPVVLEQALINRKEIDYSTGDKLLVNKYIKNSWFYPGAVSNVTFSIDKYTSTVIIAWNKPFNLRIMSSWKNILYNLVLKVCSRVVSVETVTYTVSVKLSTDDMNCFLANFSQLQLWIKTKADDIEGMETHSY